jgi:hypothetical protein
MSQENVEIIREVYGHCGRLIDLGDRVLALARQNARGKMSGAPIEQNLGTEVGRGRTVVVEVSGCSYCQEFEGEQPAD